MYIVYQYDALSITNFLRVVVNEDVTKEEMPTIVPTLENVDIRRPTKQSSTGWGHTSNRAVDNFPD